MIIGQNPGHSHWSQRQTLLAWSGSFSLLGTNTRHRRPIVTESKQQKSNKRNEIIKVTTLEKQKGAKSHFSGVKWRLLGLPTQDGPHNSSTGIRGHVHNTTGTRAQTLSGPSNTCWVQSLQHMPWPHTHTHTGLLQRWSWSQLHKYTTVTSFTS